MEMLSGAEMVVRSLIDQGVKHVFGYRRAVLDIYDALHTVEGSIIFWCATSRGGARGRRLRARHR